MSGEGKNRRRRITPDLNPPDTHHFRVAGEPVKRDEFERVRSELHNLGKKVQGLPAPDSHPDDAPMNCRCGLLLAIKNTNTGQFRLNFDRISIWFSHPATIKCRRCGELVPTKP